MSDDLEEVCTHCGKQIDPSIWHPIAAEKTEEGVKNIHQFCDEKCRSDWEESDE